jgi:flavin reductase (DIM6/NTAB) family NADH-FMN oxidoreductase RutF
MDQIEIEKNFFIPLPVVLVGKQVSRRANFMTAGWCAWANASPLMILCGIGRHSR